MKNTIGLIALAICFLALNLSIYAGTPFDFDGDGKAEIAFFRPSNGTWYFQNATTGQLTRIQPFGQSGDKVAPADFDGDGIYDISVYRPSDYTHYFLLSANNAYTAQTRPFSLQSKKFIQVQPCNADTDFCSNCNGDDYGIYQVGKFIWRPLLPMEFFEISGTINTPVYLTDVPVSANYTVSNACDATVFRPSESTYYIRRITGNSVRTVSFGNLDTLAAAADYDGDGITDPAVFVFHGYFDYISSIDGLHKYSTVQLTDGSDNWVPVSADFDGDGKANFAAYNKLTTEWRWIRNDNTTVVSTYSFDGQVGDIPIPGFLSLNQ